MSSRIIDTSISILAFVSIVLILAEFLIPMIPRDILIILVVDLGICLIFAADFLIRISKTSNKRKYLKSHWYEIIAFVPAIAFVMLESGIVFGAALRSARVLRLARFILVFSRFQRSTSIISEYISKSRLLYLTSIAAIIVVLGAIGVLIFERDVPGAKIKTLSDALWWTLATVTTVGYGDVVPLSHEGRILGVIVMIVGIAFLSVFISTLGATLVEKRMRPKENTLSESTVDIIKMKLDQLDTLSPKELTLLIHMVETLVRNKNSVREKDIPVK